MAKNRYKNHGPLVFKPFHEKSAFKPITPVPKSQSKALYTDSPRDQADGMNGIPPSLAINVLTTSNPAALRICGTRLKRHLSNVETYNAKRIDECNSMSDDEDSTSTTPTSPLATVAAIRGKGLHYADLLPIGNALANTSNLNSTNTITSSKNVSNYGSASESNSHSNSKSMPVKDQTIKTNGLLSTAATTTPLQSNSNGVSSVKRTTQYATLKFNEVNI